VALDLLPGAVRDADEIEERRFAAVAAGVVSTPPVCELEGRIGVPHA
jgi:hypothetical protein